MFYLFKFWKLNSHIEQYLKDVATFKIQDSYHLFRKKIKLKLLILLIFLKSVHLIFISQYPLLEFSRLVHFDVTLFWSGPQIINLLNSTFGFVLINVLFYTYWFYLQDYQQQLSLQQNLFFSPLNLIRQVVILKRDSTFLCKKSSSKTPILTIFHRQQKLFKLVSHSIICFVFIVIFHYEYCLGKYFFCKYHKRIFTEFSGLFYLLLTHLNQFGMLLILNIGSSANLVVGQLMFSFTIIALIRLKQAKNLLINRKRNHTKLLPVTRFTTFTQYHTQTVVLIFGANKLFGGFILGFILTQLPLNTYFLLHILMGRLNLTATLFLTSIVTIQLVVVIGLHSLCAIFSFAIKSFAGHIYYWSSLGAYEAEKRGVDLKLAIKLAIYVEKFDNDKKYGINYGSVSVGVISFYSFAKFLLFYFEFLMFWLKNTN